MIQDVTVGPITYEVKEVDEIRDGSAVFDGMIYYNEARIEIAKELDPQFKRVVVMHEVAHALLKHAGQASSDEKLVTALGYALVDLIRQNPGLIYFLTKEDAE